MYPSQLYHGCWWPGDARSQTIRKIGIKLVCPEYSGLSTRRVNTLIHEQHERYLQTMRHLQRNGLSVGYIFAVPNIRQTISSTDAEKSFMSICVPTTQYDYPVPVESFLLLEIYQQFKPSSKSLLGCHDMYVLMVSTIISHHFSTKFILDFIRPLRWRHNDHAGVSNHQPHGCLLNRLFRRKSKKTSKLRVTGLCAGNSPGTGEFPAQMVSYAENVSIWWRHHAN